MSQKLRAKLEDLEDLLDTGLLSTVVDGQQVTFRSQAEIQQRIHAIKVRLGRAKKRSGVKSIYFGGR